MTKENLVDAVNKILGEPIDSGFSETAMRVRRNLLVFSFISIFLVIGKVQIDPQSTIFGLKFIGLSDSMLKNGLLLATLYLYVHFLWYTIDSFIRWRVRVTGTKLAFLTGAKYTSEHGDYPNDPQQSTLYSWWTDHAKRIGNIGEKIGSIDKSFMDWENKVRDSIQGEKSSLNISNACNTIGETRNGIADLKRSIDTVQKTLSDSRIPVSLKRFDGWFGFFLKSQNLRWLLIDALAPLSAGAIAIYLLLKHGFPLTMA